MLAEWKFYSAKAKKKKQTNSEQLFGLLVCFFNDWMDNHWCSAASNRIGNIVLEITFQRPHEALVSGHYLCR